MPEYAGTQGPSDFGIHDRRKEDRATKSVIEHKTRAPGRFLRVPKVMARTGLSRSTTYVRLVER